jgi:uncharacterized protein with von Willebrand factor type A (vWA) domain
MADPQRQHAGGDVLLTLTEFTFALRLAGVAVTIEKSMNFLRAATVLDLLDREQIYWAGRATLCTDPADNAAFDSVFAAFFADRGQPPPRRVSPIPAPRRLLPVESGAAQDVPGAPPDRLPALASDLEVLRHKDFAALTDRERAELTRLIALLAPHPPQRRSHRFEPSKRGAVDPGSSMRTMLRGGGELAALRRRRHRQRPRRLVLLIDVSGSMAPYADPLLRFAHTAKRRLGNTCEVFTLGTTLTRLTPAMAERDPEIALNRVATVIPDWSGGTRLGSAMRAFLDLHGQRGMARGAVVVVFSDGWERGGAELLTEQAARISRLARTFIWVNPHQGKDGYLPLQSGIVAVQPFCDHLLAGHSLATLAELTRIIRRA